MRRAFPLRQLLLIYVLFCAGCGNDKKHDTLFTQLDKDQTGVNFQNTLFDGEPLNVLNYIYFYNGGGVAVGDITMTDWRISFSPAIWYTTGFF